jgi:diguanylate cyclase (GGDEF)-like protein
MKVLVAEDDSVFRFALVKLLKKWGYEAVPAGNGTEAWELLQQEDAPRLVLLDWMMPGRSGVELCREIRTRNKQAYTYVILLSGKAERKDTVDGLQAGADDYLVKPFDRDELRARLLAGQRILDLQQQLLATQHALEFQATHDPLTELWNRRMILDHLAQELSRASRYHTPTAVLMVDLDHFKEVNDTFGHLAGDAVLREVARRLQAHIRPYDGIGRYGGEEFLLVAAQTDGASARVLAERLRSSVSCDPVATQEGTISVTLSLGVAVAESSALFAADDLLLAADAALYGAKRSGRNRTELTCLGQRIGPVPEKDSTGIAVVDAGSIRR